MRGRKLWNAFFTPLPEKTVGRFRIALGLVTLLHLLTLAAPLRAYFSDDGYLTTETARKLAPGYVWSALYYIQSYQSTALFYALICLSAIFLLIGLLPQVASLLCYIGLVSFLNRFPNISYGGFLFLGCALLFAVFLPLDARLTPISFKKIPYNQVAFSPDLSAWAARMIQIEVCTIYFFSSAMKIQQPHWRDGTQLLYTLNLYGAYWNFTWLAHYPSIVAVLTWGTLVLELLAPVLLWTPPVQKYWVTGLCCLHLGIALTMNVTFLGETMIGLLFVFM